MTAQLTFDLDDYNDKMAHLRCVKATEMAIVLFELQANLKKNTVRQLEVRLYSNSQLLDLVFETIDDLIIEQGLNIEELIV